MNQHKRGWHGPSAFSRNERKRSSSQKKGVHRPSNHIAHAERRDAAASATVTYGNSKAWDMYDSWLERARLTGGRKICVLLGPPGIGKTSGVHARAQKSNDLVSEHCGGEIGSEKQLVDEVTQSATRSSLTGQNVVVLIDDVDSIPEEIATSVIKLAASGVDGGNPIVFTCGTATLPLQLLPLKEHCFVIYMAPLQIEDVKSVVQSKYPTLPRRVTHCIAASSHGDARQALCWAEIEQMQNSTGDPQIQRMDFEGYQDPFTAARTILYEKCTLNRAIKLYQHGASTNTVMQTLLFQNYIQALAAGTTIEIEDVQQHADIISSSDTLRSGNLHAPLPETEALWAMCSFSKDARKQKKSTERLNYSKPPYPTKANVKDANGNYSEATNPGAALNALF